MSENESEDTSAQEGTGIDDEQLPDDLQPGEDNPLAEGLDDGESVDGLLDGGKHADEESDEDSGSDDTPEGDGTAR